jgi:biopolymer transport protein ExbB/TolQ
VQVSAWLSSFIYIVSSFLLYPTLLLLSFLPLWMLFYAGAFVAEWLERRNLKPVPAGQLPRLLADQDPRQVFSHRVLAYLHALRSLLADSHAVSEPVIENHLQETILGFAKSLDKLRMLVRIGPGLGLMGTLIPLGTGLAALGRGDMTKLTSDLVVAFTTTVVGLAVGMSAYFLHTIKKRWVEHDIRMIEFITETLTGPLTGGTANAIHEEEEDTER